MTAAPHIKIFRSKKLMVSILSRYIRAAASTIGKTQYPKTHTHWKNDICPPNNLVLTVTTNEPPHMIKNRIPKLFPWV